MILVSRQRGHQARDRESCPVVVGFCWSRQDRVHAIHFKNGWRASEEMLREILDQTACCCEGALPQNGDFVRSVIFVRVPINPHENVYFREGEEKPLTKIYFREAII